MTENTTASGAADDSLLICASDLQHSAIYDTPREMVGCIRAVADRITALAAAAPVAPTREAEAVRWEFRWLNPANNPCSSPSEMAWKLVEPKGMQPLEAALSDLRAYRYAGNPCYEVRPLFAEAAPVAPAPQPAVPDGFVLVPVEPTQEMEAAAYRNSSTYGGGPGADYRAMIAAAPKAAPAINKVSDIIDAYGMTPGEPERVADIPGLAEALEAAFADGSAQITGATPLQQGEYLPCPFCGNVSINLTVIDDRSFIMCNSCGACCDSNDTLPEDEPGDVWNRRAARGAAQASPAEDDKWRSLALQFDSHRMQALSHLKLLLECGEDHADAQRIAAYAQPAPVAEDAEIRKALHDAATSLETISSIAGRDKDMLGMMDVRLYAAARAKAAREAQAAQPEGGA